MKSIFTLVFSLVICLNLICQDRESDSLALVSIFSDLGGTSWTENGDWLSEKPIQEWEGIQVKDDRITKIRLANNNIKGVFPSALYSLTALRKIDIFNVEIEGNISNEINSLSNLERLVANNCGLSGLIIADFSMLTKLSYIKIATNNLTGQLPLLPLSIETFQAGYNELEGEIPSSWMDLNLEALDLEGNQLTGDFEIISSMEHINNLVLSQNNWDEGPLPEWLDDLPNLKRFLCTSCNLIGEIPAYDFSNTPDYYQIFIDNNKLSGNLAYLFPTKEMQNNFWLQASDNEFEGELPLDMIHDFFKLYVNKNKYSSLSSFDYSILKGLRIYQNNFTPSGFLPGIQFLVADTLLNMQYFNQNYLLDKDTIMVTEAASITIEAGDEFEGNVYSWYKDNELIDGATSSSLEVMVNQDEGDGIYYCEFYHPDVIAENGEVGIFTRNEVVILKDIASLLSNLEESAINLFPNPTSHTLNFSKSLSGKFVISNILGQTVKSGTFLNDSHMSVHHLETGQYFLNYSKDGQKNILKFTVQ